jgi:hypothetical protein
MQRTIGGKRITAFMSNMENAIDKKEGYVSFPIYYNSGISEIVKIKQINGGFNIRLYYVVDEFVEAHPEIKPDDKLIKLGDTDSRVAKFSIQFDAKSIFISENISCMCESVRSYECNGPRVPACAATVGVTEVTAEQFESYKQTSIRDKRNRFIGSCILANLGNNTYIAISGTRVNRWSATRSPTDINTYLFSTEHPITHLYNPINSENESDRAYAKDTNNKYYLIKDCQTVHSPTGYDTCTPHLMLDRYQKGAEHFNIRPMKCVYFEKLIKTSYVSTKSDLHGRVNHRRRRPRIARLRIAQPHTVVQPYVVVQPYLVVQSIHYTMY